MKEKFDSKELELPDTLFIRDIETRVFQTIALQALSQVEGVFLIEGNLIDSFLGRDGPDRIKGIHVDQDQKKHSVKLKVEINTSYGVCLPEKAEEIQSKLAKEISRLTGIHVSSVHVVFKNLILPSQRGEIELENKIEETIENVPDVEEAIEFCEKLNEEN